MKKFQLKFKGYNLFLMFIVITLLAIVNTFIKEFIAELIFSIVLLLVLVHVIKHLNTSSKEKLDSINKYVTRGFKGVCFIIVFVAILVNITTQKELLNKYINYSTNIEIVDTLDNIIRFSDSCTKIIAISCIEIIDTVKYYSAWITKNAEQMQIISEKYIDIEDKIGKNIIKTILNCRSNLKAIKLAIQFNFMTLISIVISLLSFNKSIKRK